MVHLCLEVLIMYYGLRKYVTKIVVQTWSYHMVHFIKFHQAKTKIACHSSIGPMMFKNVKVKKSIFFCFIFNFMNNTKKKKPLTNHFVKGIIEGKLSNISFSKRWK